MNAIMIMFHKNVDQVTRMVETLSDENFDIFIHADSNLLLSDEAKNKIASASTKSNIYFTEKRYHGVLDTQSLVDIAIELVKTAKINGNYKYYLLLSGQDYPIKPMAYISKQLDDTYPKPYIDCTPYDKHNWIFYKFAINASILRFQQFIRRKKKGSLTRNSLRIIEIIIKQVVACLHLDFYTSLTKQNIELYGGSAWWILPDICIDYILSEYNSNKAYISELLSTLTPEESFFQIMAMRSECNNLIKINPIDMVEQNCKTYAYFSGKSKPFKGHPYEFTINDIELLREKSEDEYFWFARKFDIEVDSKILDLIDKEFL
ncbi:MAG: beta-1,6-N-acetylglucosaminyltransferase [Bacilli bacterium]|uniref:beta-1,6-N-acetylglucosaminyltransferase n=1 Tax=Anaerorhabdus sp. TaxID=1872524 RepID=UPI002FCABDB6